MTNTMVTEKMVDAALKAMSLVAHQSGFTAHDHERVKMRAALRSLQSGETSND